MRHDLGRRPGDELHWKNIKTHDQRVRAAQMLGAAPFLRICTVVVCKRDFDPGKGSIPDDDFAYMFTFRFLLERMSWLCRDSGGILRYTLAMIGGFRLSQLRHYEAVLKGLTDCTVHWAAVDSKGGSIDQPNRFGNVETRYLELVEPRLYRYKTSPVTSYGLKMHPWNAKSRAAHPWLGANWPK